MKSVFEENTRHELIGRIHSLSMEHKAQWGKMNVYQMVKHCALWDEWILGVKHPIYKQGFWGHLFGRWALRINLKDDSPLRRNTPTGKYWIVREKVGDLELHKKLWTAHLSAYAQFSNPDFIHDFFGRMTNEEIGFFAYKHSDHHLRQFGA